MHLVFRNINDAFRGLVGVFVSGGQSPRHSSQDVYVHKQVSRNGTVLVIEEPVTITYTHPRERVLFNTARDANPFFHLYESLWMLAGRNDVASVAYYAKQMKEYSDDGVTLNGTYGYRWRHAPYWRLDPNRTNEWGCEQVDQLHIIINHLKANPTSRRAVLQMWNVEDDLLRVDSSKDVCCNLSVMFSLRKATRADIETYAHNGYLLDMTVTNRSNDMIWGLLGANYVHFTILQEYIAAHLGVGIGRYHHFTNNLHVYEWNWRPQEWLQAESDQQKYLVGYAYDEPDYNHVPLIHDPKVFDKELSRFVEEHGKLQDPRSLYGSNPCNEPFLREVATPMFLAFHCHKLKDSSAALAWANDIKADDWRMAATQWLNRRAKNEAQNKD